MKKILNSISYFLIALILPTNYLFAYYDDTGSKIIKFLSQISDVLLFVLVPIISIFLILKINKYYKTPEVEFNLRKKQKKSIRIKIAFIIFIVLISISIKLFVATINNNNKNLIKNTTNLIIDLTTTGLSITPAENLNTFIGKDLAYCSIRDEKNVSIQESKKVFLKSSKISEEYFNKHFVFVCGNNTNLSKIESYYVFKIDDYSTTVNLQYSTFNHEIKDLLSPQTAIEKLVLCLGNRPTGNISTSFIPPSNSLYLTGSSNRNWAKINLETGECNKMGIPSSD